MRVYNMWRLSVRTGVNRGSNPPHASKQMQNNIITNIPIYFSASSLVHVTYFCYEFQKEVVMEKKEKKTERWLWCHHLRIWDVWPWLFAKAVLWKRLCLSQYFFITIISTLGDTFDSDGYAWISIPFCGSSLLNGSESLCGRFRLYIYVESAYHEASVSEYFAYNTSFMRIVEKLPHMGLWMIRY